MTMMSDERAALAAMPVISHILETSLYVAELDRARIFYESVFSFDVIFADDRMCALRVPGSGVLLLFKEHGSLQPSRMLGGVIPGHGGSGALHLCFAIPLAAVEHWAAHLERQGVPIESRVRQFFGGTSLYFRDPDGHSLEVATPGLWPNF